MRTGLLVRGAYCPCVGAGARIAGLRPLRSGVGGAGATSWPG
ncbi:hypothetical protein P376_4022 [Streptomyces sp. HCCB10043]|nr:hypothetical protein P376_4022 [Streptomyces sp. HCCB10043]